LNRQQYQQYVDHFNHRRYDSVVSYFTPDITVEYYDNGVFTGTPAKTLFGREGFVASYKTLHAHTREVLELGDFLAQGELLFVELYTEFHTFQDSPPNQGTPRKKGDIQVMTNWVMYNMDSNDRMKRIRIAHFRMYDPATARFK
jgi:hypothetical protein